MWFFYALFAFPAAYAASKVGPHYGFLAGFVTLAAVMATQAALLGWVVARVTGQSAAAQPAAATPSADGPEAEPDDEPGDEPEVRLRYGEHARFKQVVLIADDARPDVTHRLYDRLKRAIEAFVDVETGRGGSGAEMVSAAELAPADGESAAPPADTLTMFVSNDGTWSGFRVGDDCFRFRHGAITRLQLTHVMPLRWKGDYMVTLWFDVPKRKQTAEYVSHSTWFDLDLEHSDRRSRTLTHACREIASVLDAAFDVSEASDA
ncbi:hypothetical protein [Burkholderia pyrrocinia]|uniref:hypothetical protein n=1 Tax=Burkholderia pyrrocinia TaxID=60550 RepID=UPI001BCDDC1E|nr:hypothetical protein [Burkholderia pyrrocinia]QVN22071.1 hypothetical protein JYG32_22125 [Burkholderia pyrrocinia]